MFADLLWDGASSYEPASGILLHSSHREYELLTSEV